MFAIPIMLLALLGLGSLAVFVFGIVYAIINKRPGVAVASVLAPVAVLFGGALLVALLARSDTVMHSRSPIHRSWSAIPAMPPMPSMPAIPAAPPIAEGVRLDPDVAIWIILGAVLFGVIVVARRFRHRASCCGERRGGWGKTLAVTLLVVLAANFLILRASHNSSMQTVRVAKEDQIRQQEEQQRAKEAQGRAEVLAIEGKSMQELWEKLNESRINLESDSHGADMEAGEGPHQIVMRSSDEAGTKLIAPPPADSAESLARSLARVERMVERVSTVANRISDAGTLIGKAMIALNDSIDSRRQSATQSTVIPSLQAPPAPAVQEIAADAKRQGAPSPSSLKLVSEVRTEAPREERAELAARTSAPTRPAWVGEMPKRVGNTQRAVIVAGEYATVEECYEKSDELLKQATIDYMNQFAGGRVGFDKRLMGPGDVLVVSQPSLLDRMGIGIDYIRREIAKDEYVETVERSFGPMKKLYTRVEFSPSVDQELRRQWDEYRRQERFAVVGAGAGSVLGLIGLAFGLLKADTWTKGYYTKRLFLGVPTAIIMGATLLWVDPLHLF